MKKNLFTMSLVSIAMFACGGRVDDGQNGIVGISSVAGTTNSIAGTTSLEPSTYSAGGAINVSTGGTTSVAGSVSETATGGATVNPETNVTSSTGGSSTISTGGTSSISNSTSTKPACGPYTIKTSGSTTSVPRYLEFRLNSNSLSGTVTSGMQKVIAIDATAHCGDIQLDKVLFQAISESAGSMAWIQHLVKVNTGISYTQNGVQTLHSYGPNAQSQPENSMTAVYWNHTFAQKIIVKDGETFTFSLSIPLDDMHLPLGTIQFNLYGRATWKGLDHPDEYPADILFDTITGNPITYRGTINGKASYCEEAMGTTHFGYRGCCGSFQSYQGMPPAGSLIKASGSSVYYLGKNGKRYVFPTSQVLDSWFGPLNWDKSYNDYLQLSSKPALFPLENPAICNAVMQIDDAILASIPIRGNVTMRPGSYITGITVDPKRYVISQGGVLRNIADVNAATALFGSSIATIAFGPLNQATLPVRLNHDAFFLDYTIGAQISSSSDYDPSMEYWSASLEKTFGAE